MYNFLTLLLSLDLIAVCFNLFNAFTIMLSLILLEIGLHKVIETLKTNILVWFSILTFSCWNLIVLQGRDKEGKVYFHINIISIPFIINWIWRLGSICQLPQQRDKEGVVYSLVIFNEETWCKLPWYSSFLNE